MSKYYHIINYGCQMNESDSEHFAGQLVDLGYEYTADYELADVIVINTCCVRESAEKKILGKIGELKHVKERHPNNVICLAGCMAQKDGAALLKKYLQLDLIIGTAYVNNFRAALEDFLASRTKEIYSEQKATLDEFNGNFVRKSSYAAWIPIMYGCNNFCTYCIVPYVRGRERSRSQASIIAEIKRAVSEGYKDITLLGQNVNSYGKDIGVTFAELLQAVDAVAGVERIHYMTSHPRDMKEDVVQAIASSRHICPNFHVPVQAGSNKILQAMNRGYTRETYLELIATIRRYVPDAAITTDIIVGFPGETEEDFEATLRLVQEVQYDAAYTFIYSKRSGTPAAKMAEQVPLAVKKERLRRLMDIQNTNSLLCNQKMLGQTVEVMVEGPSTNNETIWNGRTTTNKLVLFPKGELELVPGQVVKVLIDKAQTWLVKGKCI